MASKRNKGGSGRPLGDHEVGYCRPPEATRFKKDDPSPNPYGCRGKPKGEADRDTFMGGF
jgi:hypothetical protein